MSGRFAGPLPRPLARLRELRIHRAKRIGRARNGKTASVDGFELMLPMGVDAPLVAGGLHRDAFLGRNLDVRAGERVLVAPPNTGIVALQAARAGADVTLMASAQQMVAMERSFRLGGFGAPSSILTLAEDRFDAMVLCERHGPIDFARWAGHLGRGGRLLMAMVDRDDGGLRAELDRSGLAWTTLVLRRDAVFGPMRVIRAWRSDRGGYVEAGEALPGAAWVLRDR